jgi:hypothetical protein
MIRRPSCASGGRPLARRLPAAESLEARLERLERDREFLLLHSQNLERELCRLAGRRDRDDPDPGPNSPDHVRDLEARLVELTSAYDAVVNSRTWRAFAPYRALRGWVLRRFRR